ncbi:ThiF family adenylyltransferase [Pararobbsia silviterrae]|uniref:ThiF family adenylyltransferase n=1 Tax=Pararobbsia silviterrae TaxID=1792498 RepID=A0A494Y9N2_9BURK|nr:ThiF family adenylyltransferase [Pararobbsia silviterrae]RKP59329.1 ThiF family adenylyltransferase [Pararobbsia silviterrae]
MLVRRKASVLGCPYLMFMVQYGNHVHQIALPMPKEDGMGREPVQTSLSYFPHPWESDRLSISSAALVKATKLARYEGLSIVFAHSHPGGLTAFSEQDDREEEKLVPFFQARVPNRLHGTLVLTEESIAGRIYSSQRYEVDDVIVVGQRIRLHSHDVSNLDPIYDRQVRAFGPAIQQSLDALTIGIVGLGGTGSACAEQLARLGIGRLLLFDHDRLDGTNLNRVYGANSDDVGRNKAVLAAARLAAAGLGGTYEAVPASILEQGTARRLRECDVIFGCTDKELPRSILCQVALKYHIPVLDMGVLIDSQDGVIEGIFGRVTTLTAGDACLFCRGRITPERLRIEALSDEDRQQQIRQGYAPELETPAPAVIAFTSLTASHAVSELLHRLTGFMGANRVASEVVLLIDRNRIGANRSRPDENCFCSVASEWGRGDQSPFLDLVWADG